MLETFLPAAQQNPEEDKSSASVWGNKTAELLNVSLPHRQSAKEEPDTGLKLQMLLQH